MAKTATALRGPSPPTYLCKSLFLCLLRRLRNMSNFSYLSVHVPYETHVHLMDCVKDESVDDTIQGERHIDLICAQDEGSMRDNGRTPKHVKIHKHV